MVYYHLDDLDLRRGFKDVLEWLKFNRQEFQCQKFADLDSKATLDRVPLLMTFHFGDKLPWFVTRKCEFSDENLFFHAGWKWPSGLWCLTIPIIDQLSLFLSSKIQNSTDSRSCPINYRTMTRIFFCLPVWNINWEKPF